MKNITKLIRITTVPISLEKLIAGQMKFMANHGFNVCMVSSNFDGVEELELKENAKFIPLEMARAIAPITDLVSLVNMIRLIRKLQPTIVHTHTPKAGLIGMLASWLTSVPIRLHTVAGLPLMEEKGLKRFILNQVEKLTYACATKVYPNSKNLEKFILDQGFTNPNKLKVIGNGSSNGINTSLFTKSKIVLETANELVIRYNIKPTDFVFIFIGRLVKDKGIEELVYAFDHLVKKYPAIKLLLVGSEESELDPLSNSCLNIIHNNSAIIAVGFQNDVRPYLALAKVLAFPSYREGFPNVPMQAGCFDLPCIVTDINGCNEIIIEGLNGLIIPVKDTTALQNAMEKMLCDTNLFEAMADKARLMIVERYEQEKVWKLILNEYQMHLKAIEIN